MDSQMPPQRRRCQLRGQFPDLPSCAEPMTYSEHGHWLAGEYCDKHGLAVHRLRRGSPCPCGHCDGARGRVQRKIEREAADEVVTPSNEEETEKE